MWLYKHWWMISTSLNHCKEMGAEPGRRSLKMPAEKLGPVIVVVTHISRCPVQLNNGAGAPFHYLWCFSVSPIVTTKTQRNSRFCWRLCVERGIFCSWYRCFCRPHKKKLKIVSLTLWCYVRITHLSHEDATLSCVRILQPRSSSWCFVHWSGVSMITFVLSDVYNPLLFTNKNRFFAHCPSTQGHFLPQKVISMRHNRLCIS